MLRKIKIAVIDSGINETYIPQNVKIISSIDVQMIVKKSVYIYVNENKSFSDLHGTKVINTVAKYCENCLLECYSFNIMNKDGKSSSYALLEALKMARNIENLDIITLSLSCGEKLKEEFERVLSELSEKKVAIFSAVQNGRTISYPASSGYVYGVIGGLIKRKGEYRYNNREIIQIECDKGPEFFRYNDMLLVFSGNSKANAVAAGIYINNKFSFKIKNISHEDYFEISDDFDLKKLIVYDEEVAGEFEKHIGTYVADFDLCTVSYYEICDEVRILKYIGEHSEKIFENDL